MRHYTPPKKRGKQRFFSFVLIVLLVGAALNFARPLPHADASIVALTSQLNEAKLAWPSSGYSAFGAQGYGVLATHGSQEQRPMASISKLVTVLAVLEKHPLKPGQQGPTLTMTAADLALFNKYYGLGGSYVKVEVGEKISEYQALQAILLPSANNMADSLAVWAYGSMDNYHAFANSMLKQLGFKDTTVAADASGFDPASLSTPSDLVKLGERAMNNPVIAEIVAQKSATIPVHGIIYSANSRLGYNNIIGIKTGLTDQAGGCFLFAAKHEVGGKSVTMIGAVMHQPTLRAALDASEPLLNSAKKYFSVQTPIKAGEVFATLKTKWNGASADVVAKNDISIVSWQGAAMSPRVELDKINGSIAAGTEVGTAIVSSGSNTASTPLILKEAISGPTWQWRLQRLQ